MGLQYIKTLSVFVQHQGINFQFTAVPKLHQGTAAKRGAIVWRALFSVGPDERRDFLEKQKRKKPAVGVGKLRSKKLLR